MKKHLPLIYILLVLLGLSVAYPLVTHYTTENYILTDLIEVHENTILIGKGCVAIVGETTADRANAIQMGIEKRIDSRPLTHDSFAEVLKSFNITLEAVKINNIDSTSYYSDMILNQGNKVLTLDTSPADAIAIALRMDAPIYINKTLLEEVGQVVC